MSLAEILKCLALVVAIPTAAVVAAVAGCLVVAAVRVACASVLRRIRRDVKPRNAPLASDGSRHWGKKMAEAEQGRVVTKESGPAPGSSRERAAEALAEAERKATGKWTPVDGYTQHATLSYEPMTCLGRDLTPFSLEIAEAPEHYSLSHEDAVLLFASVGGALEAHKIHTDAASSPPPEHSKANRGHAGDRGTNDPEGAQGATPCGPTYTKSTDGMAYMIDSSASVPRWAPLVATELDNRYREERDAARTEADQLRGALTECRRELAEARAAQAVPVPSQGTFGGSLEVIGSWQPGALVTGTPLWFTCTSADLPKPIADRLGVDPVLWTPPPADGTCS